MTPDVLHHGGRIAHAAQNFGGDPAQWLDLSTGINPVPWPIPQALSCDWTALPDPDALAALEADAARHFGAEPALTCAVPGSEAGLRMLALMLNLPGRAPQPSYRSHSEAFARSRPIRFGEVPDQPEVVVLANPNNPDGTLHPAHAMLDWAERIAAADSWLIIDNAFADCQPEAAIAGPISGDVADRLIVLRSFGKFFGLAGVRLGFVIAPLPIAQRLRAMLGSWPLHAAALEIGRAAYADTAWIRSTRAQLPRRAAALDAVLHRHGLAPQGACPLFRYVTGCNASALFERLARARILTRPFSEHRDALRFGVPADPLALERLDAALGHG